MYSISNRNQIIIAIHSFFRYVQAEEVVDYITIDEIKLLLEQSDKHNVKCRRDNFNKSFV